MTGSGTALDPYVISTVTDLQNMENDLTAYYELGGDIDASATTTWNAGAGFLPIGQGDYFTGQLDGKDYTISDLFISRNENYQALFYNIDTGCVIQNVKMVDVDISATAGSAHGALVAYMNAGTITNCSSTGSMAGSGTSDMVGGLIGQARTGTISKCWSSCVVTVGDDYGGGFIGATYGGVTIDDCYALGDVTTGDDYAGGFIGDNYGGVIDDCYSIGTATATGGFGEGGFAGYHHTYLGSGGTETNCFWDTETSGNATDGGSATGKTTAQMKTFATFTAAGWSTAIWFMSAVINNGYPSFYPPGSETTRRLAIVGTQLQYVDEYGTTRYLLGVPV